MNLCCVIVRATSFVEITYRGNNLVFCRGKMPSPTDRTCLALLSHLIATARCHYRTNSQHGTLLTNAPPSWDALLFVLFAQKDPGIGDNTSTPASTLHTKQRVANPINWEKAETHRGARPSTTEGGLAAQRPSLQEQPSPPSPLTPPPGCITTVVACVILLFWRFGQRRGRDRAANREVKCYDIEAAA